MDRFGGSVVHARSTLSGARSAAADGLDLAEAQAGASIDELLSAGEGGALLRARIADSGEVQWVPVADAPEAQRAVLARSQMASMLKDARRCSLYGQAIAAAVRATAGGAPRVLDIGAGTGLLGLLAARAGASAVTACEQWDTCAAVARAVVAANGGGVEVAACHSGALPPARAGGGGGGAELVVSEIVDSALLGEGIIPALRDAYARLAAPGAAAVPAGATVLAQLVHCPALAAMGGDTTRACLQPAGASSSGAECLYARTDWAPRCAAPPAPFPVRPSRLPMARLTPPLPAMTIDFSSGSLGPGGAQAHPPPGGGPEQEARHARLPPLPAAPRALPANAVLWWWRLALREGVEEYDSSEEGGAGQWQDHWLPMLHPLPCEVPPAPAGEGEGEGGGGWSLVCSRTATGVHFFVGQAGAQVWDSPRAYNLHKRAAAAAAAAAAGGGGAGAAPAPSPSPPLAPSPYQPPPLFTEPSACSCGLHEGSRVSMERRWALGEGEAAPGSLLPALREGVRAALHACVAAGAAEDAALLAAAVEAGVLPEQQQQQQQQQQGRVLRVLDLGEGGVAALLAATTALPRGCGAVTRAFTLAHSQHHAAHTLAVAAQCGVGGRVLVLPTAVAGEVSALMVAQAEAEAEAEAAGEEDSEEGEDEEEGEEEGEEEEGGGGAALSSGAADADAEAASAAADGADDGHGEAAAAAYSASHRFDALLSEPYLAATALHPLHTLTALWRRCAGVRHLLRPGAPLLPARAHIHLAAIACPQLHASASAGVGSVCGLAHGAFDDAVGARWAHAALPLPLWQYSAAPVGGAGVRALSVELGAPPAALEARCVVGRGGGAHAVVAWVVWEVGGGRAVDTGPRWEGGEGGGGGAAPSPHRQAVHFLLREAPEEGVAVRLAVDPALGSWRLHFE